MPELTLFHFPPSGPSRIALLAARSVGVDIDIKIVDLFKKEQLNSDFVKLNPQHTVPTLVDGDFVLWESRVIAIYLAETYGKDDSLYPKDLQRRAIVNQRLYFNHGCLYTRIRAICFPILFLGETEISGEKKKSLEESFDFLDIFLKQSPWVAGQNLTIADCACAASVSTIVAVGYDVSKHKPIADWLERCKAQMPGYNENEEGANTFGQEVRKRLKPGQL